MAAYMRALQEPSEAKEMHGAAEGLPAYNRQHGAAPQADFRPQAGHTQLATNMRKVKKYEV